jgi:hypothetical protein
MPWVGQLPGVVEVRLPLWIPFVLLALPTAWLWYRDRRRPPGSCPRCGYDLSGAPSGLCPECGGLQVRQGRLDGPAAPRSSAAFGTIPVLPARAEAGEERTVEVRTTVPRAPRSCGAADRRTPVTRLPQWTALDLDCQIPVLELAVQHLTLRALILRTEVCLDRSQRVLAAT